MKDWAQHQNFYTCNLFEQGNKENKNVNKKRLSLQRYLHYHKRFTTHESSVAGDLKIINLIETVAKAYMETQRLKGKADLSWNDIQFLTDAVKSLTNGRKALKWTYCFAFYLEPSNFGDIFEDNQNYLNETVEELSGVFQRINTSKNVDKVAIILKEQKKIINLSSLIQVRQKRLIEGCNENLLNGLIRFA
jgi:ariadne-1